MGAPNQQAAWPHDVMDLNEQETTARDHARTVFAARARGFSKSHEAGPLLLQAAVAALRAGKPENFHTAVDGVRSQLDELERLWAVACGSTAKVTA